MLDFLLGKPQRSREDIDLVMTMPDAERVLEWLKRECIAVETQVPGAVFRFDYQDANFKIEYGNLGEDGSLLWQTKVARIGYIPLELEGKAVEIPGTKEKIETLAPEAIYLIKEHLGREKDKNDMKLLEPRINWGKIAQIKSSGFQWYCTPVQLEEIRKEKRR